MIKIKGLIIFDVTLYTALLPTIKEIMEKSHVVCLLGGAALASAFFLLKNAKNKNGQGSSGKEKEVDVDSEQYQGIKKEQLARVIKYFGEDKFSKL